MTDFRTVEANEAQKSTVKKLYVSKRRMGRKDDGKKSRSYAVGGNSRREIE